MNTVTNSLDQGLSENIGLSVEMASVVILVGKRQFDRFVVTSNNTTSESTFTTLSGICNSAAKCDLFWSYDPAQGIVSLDRSTSEINVKTPLPTVAGDVKQMPLSDVIRALEELESPHPNQRTALLIDAALLVEDPNSPRDADFLLVRSIERFSRSSNRNKIIFMRAAHSANIPCGIGTSINVRTVNLPMPSRDERYAYALIRAEKLAELTQSSKQEVAKLISGATEDWVLDQIEALIQSSLKQKLSRLSDLDELARAMVAGHARSPWAGDQIRESVRQSDSLLERRVQGQDAAIRSISQSLRKAVVGLTGAHQSRSAQTPRAVYFMAGPTGTGKSESAKAISELIFGNEVLLRFDCAELRQDHAVARLIGAPPGYVGHDKGGELTDGVRSKPNCVILMDEVEKAAPKLFDIFLSILDDGRLTSGQGETTFFGQSVLVFTSNLGMYEESVDAYGRSHRTPRFNYQTPYEQIQTQVRDAVREHFVNVLGRPELLGRFGGAENVIVFDYLRNPSKVGQKFISNIQEKVARLQGIHLNVDPAILNSVVEQFVADNESLLLGGRGLAQKLDMILTAPLSDYLFDQRIAKSGIVKSTLEGDRVVFTTH